MPRPLPPFFGEKKLPTPTIHNLKRKNRQRPNSAARLRSDKSLLLNTGPYN